MIASNTEIQMRGRILAGALALLMIGLHAPQVRAQAAASVCKDGTTSAAVGKGACSGHGGVDAKATTAAKQAEKKAKTTAAKTVPAATAAKTPSLPAPVPATAPARAKSEAKSQAPSAPTAAKTAAKPSSKRGDDNDPTDALAQCKDGMYSHAANHRGACSKHGGVSKFLKP
jgi:hypothetical protein